MNSRLRIKPSFLLYLLILAYCNPYRIFYPFLCAAALHELAHIAVLLLLGKRVSALTLSFAEAELETDELLAWQTLLSAAAGPSVNVLCAAALRCAYPVFAAVSFLLAGVNLLPVLPLDGGRILEALLLMLLPEEKANAVMRIVSMIIKLSAAGLILYFAIVYGFGAFPVFLLPIWGVKTLLRRKTSCFSALMHIK